MYSSKNNNSLSQFKNDNKINNLNNNSEKEVHELLIPNHQSFEES
jgi:hypothetical protein